MRSKSEKNLIGQEFKRTKRELRRLFCKRKKEFRFDRIQNELRQKRIFEKKNIIKNYGSHHHFVTPNIPNSIRFSVTLTSNIDANILTQCIYDVAPRFPYLLLSIKQGVFSYHLEETPLVPVLHIDRLIPAPEIPYQEGSHLFRISYYMTRISIDVNLQLVDHNMARDFIMVLTNRYLGLSGLSQFDYPIHYRDFYTSEEMCQPYMLVPDTVETPPKSSENNSAQASVASAITTQNLAKTKPLENENLPRKLMKLETEFVPSLEILELDNSIEQLASANNCSLRAYVAGLLVKSIYDGTGRKAGSKLSPVKVSIVCDLRGLFPTDSYRSFVTSISHKTCSNDAVATAQILDERIRTDCNSQANSAIAANGFSQRLIPTMLRKRFTRTKLSAVVYDMGEIASTCEHINRAEFVVGTSRDCPIACGIVRSNDKIVLSLNSNLVSPNILKVFTDNLVASGIKIHLTTNRRNNLV